MSDPRQDSWKDKVFLGHYDCIHRVFKACSFKRIQAILIPVYIEFYANPEPMFSAPKYKTQFVSSVQSSLSFDVPIVLLYIDCPNFAFSLIPASYYQNSFLQLLNYHQCNSCNAHNSFVGAYPLKDLSGVSPPRKTWPFPLVPARSKLDENLIRLGRALGEPVAHEKAGQGPPR